ncbi:MAG TPA: aldo/keto reductase [Lacunisphaera sp.]|nr:aldo/keto reductase [Lacunisphaera sp.]
MNLIQLPGTPLAVSPLCLGGTMHGNTITEAESFTLLDRFVALGGNFLDTARIYSDWVPGEYRRSERIIGDWLRARGCRHRIVLATKGAHPFIQSLNVPRTSAAEIRDDLEGSLRTLRTDVIDLYWLHRDNTSHLVEHFIDLLNKFVHEGKIRAFGASNWTTDRIRAANAYAQQSGQQGFIANQPFWCLGCQQSKPPPFTGYVKLDPEMLRFHRETRMAIIPYTSQAGGFFSKLARGDGDLAGSEFHVPANLAAGKVVADLATERSVEPSAIVLAYLWSRPLTVVPIVGTHTVAQLEECFAALPIRLTTGELAALETASQSGLPASA